MAIKTYLAKQSQKVIYLTFPLNYIKNNSICQQDQGFNLTKYNKYSKKPLYLLEWPIKSKQSIQLFL